MASAGGIGTGGFAAGWRNWLRRKLLALVSDVFFLAFFEPNQLLQLKEPKTSKIAEIVRTFFIIVYLLSCIQVETVVEDDLCEEDRSTLSPFELNRVQFPWILSVISVRSLSKLT